MSTLTQFVKRPGLGKAGRQVQLRANFFPVLSLPKGPIYHYDIAISPVAPSKIISTIFKELLAKCKATDFGNIHVIFDGQKNMFSPQKLPFKDVLSVQVDISGKEGAKRNDIFDVKVKLVNIIEMEDLNNFIQGKQEPTNNYLTSVMALDVLVGYKISLTHASYNRSFYSSTNAKVLSGGIEAWQGYYQSVRPSLSRLLINTDISCRTFYQAGDLLDSIAKCLNLRSMDNLKNGIHPKDLKKVVQFVKTVVVETTHRGPNGQKFKIKGLSKTTAMTTTFIDKQSNQKMSVAEYFKDRYNIRLAYPNLPCIIANKDIHIPIEVCRVVSGQRYMRKLNEFQTSDLIRFTAVKPQERFNRIMDGAKILNHDQNEYLKSFGMKVGRELVNVQARILPSPELAYRNPDSRQITHTPRDGAWNLRDLKLCHGVTISSWGIVYVGSPKDFPFNAIVNFSRALCNSFKFTGINLQCRQPTIGHIPPLGDFQTNVRQFYMKVGNANNFRPQLLVFILPNTSTEPYAKIKHVCDTDLGVASQCVLVKHAREPRPQYCANVCLKINAKLGGVNTFITSQTPLDLNNPHTIIMGADVTHPGAGESHASISTVVSSLDNKMSQWASAISVQQSRVEIISSLRTIVSDLLKKYSKVNRTLPKRLIFYRDGVSEGQYAAVKQQEVDEIRKACLDLDPNSKISITFIIVGKRHHVRFLPLNKTSQDRSGNCLPGTIIDQDVTHPIEFDFYLYSHSGILGTSRPAHYHVIHDENNFTADSLQSFTYQMCYLFVRCSRSVSIVPPVYYAHLLATRAKLHSRSSSFSDTQSVTSLSSNVDDYDAVKENLRSSLYFV